MQKEQLSKIREAILLIAQAYYEITGEKLNLESHTESMNENKEVISNKKNTDGEGSYNFDLPASNQRTDTFSKRKIRIISEPNLFLDDNLLLPKEPPPPSKHHVSNYDHMIVVTCNKCLKTFKVDRAVVVSDKYYICTSCMGSRRKGINE